MTLLAHPGVQSVLLPAAVALAVLAVLRVTGAGRHGAVAAAAGLVVAMVAITGGGRWPPVAALHKLPWLIAAAVLAGLLADALAARRVPGVLLALAVLGAGIAWLGWPQRAAMTLATAACVLGLAAAAAPALAWLARHRDAPAAPTLVIAIGAAALAVVAVQSGSLAIGQLGGALAVSAGVLALWELVLPGARFAALALTSVVLPYYLLAAVLALLTDVSPGPLALLALTPLAGRLVPRRAPLRHAVLAGLAALVPAAAAVLLTAWGQSPTGPYYR